MQSRTILLIIAAFIVALGIAIFQYYYKTKKRGNLLVLLTFLRFLALFGVCLLLINPKITKQHFFLEKTDLLVLFDNSSSVAHLKEILESISKSFKDKKELTDRFNLKEYRFDEVLGDSDSLDFNGRNTNITNALSSINDIYANANTAIVLVTDGNQTFGQDYGFFGKNQKFPVFPIVVGDTTQYEDLRIDQVNANRYAFLNNKYPIEVFISYKGNTIINANVSITADGKRVYQEKITLTNTQNTKIVNALLEASTVGAKSIQVAISTLPNERNTVNNKKNIAIEVIDEKTKIGIISDLLHPDIGALIKAIESNEQRSATIYKPTAAIKSLEEVDLFILHQPNASFKAVYELIQKRNANSLTIAGTKTDWKFFKSIQKQYDIEENGIIQEVTPIVNTAFPKYDISDVSFEEYPPLESNAGLLSADDQIEVLLNMEIRGVTMRSPLMFVSEYDNHKEAFILGENIWKWRMQSYRDNQNFKNFDDFMGKLILYLSDNKSKDRLQLEFKSIYEGSSDAKISASYFDAAFIFDVNANLTLTLKRIEDGVSKEIPMLLKGKSYESDLSYLSPGKYTFTVTVKKDNRSKSGSFTILDFDVEQQFTSSDYKKLALLANNTNGRHYFSNQIDSLLQFVTNDERFRPIQRSDEKVVSLIDFKWLLGFIAAALSLEWFIRKYNGLI